MKYTQIEYLYCINFVAAVPLIAQTDVQKENKFLQKMNISYYF